MGEVRLAEWRVAEHAAMRRTRVIHEAIIRSRSPTDEQVCEMQRLRDEADRLFTQLEPESQKIAEAERALIRRYHLADVRAEQLEMPSAERRQTCQLDVKRKALQKTPERPADC